MSEHTSIRKWPIAATLCLGFVLVAGTVLLDDGGKRQDIWPSVLLEIGASIGLVGVLLLVERSFLRAIKAENQATVERVADMVESVTTSSTANQLTIDALPTATDRGQQPKMLVRISDPNGDYRTQWSVTLNAPSGTIYSSAASWPGSGKVFRVRFPTTEPRTGKWTGVAVRNGSESHEFTVTLPHPDAA